MQGSYFKYISIYGVIVLLAAILFSFLFSVFAGIPILNIFILIIFVYVFSIMMTVSAVIARRIVGK
jgi:ABC-type transport system involved in multi-copper enzyme maturation permease subunit